LDQRALNDFPIQVKQLPYNSLGESARDTNGHPRSTGGSFQWRRYLLFVKKYWWIPAAAALVGAGIHVFLLAREPDQFVSTARMWVSGKMQLPEGRVYQEEVQNFLGTQIALMQSQRLMDLAHNAARASRPDRRTMPVELRVSALPRTSIIVLQAIGPEPEYLQVFLDNLMDGYGKAKRDVRERATDDALLAVKEGLREKKVQLEEEQKKLEAIRNDNVVFLQAQGDAAGSRLSQLNIQREDLNRELLLLNSILTGSFDLKGISTNPAPMLANLMARLDAAGQNSKAGQEFFGALQQIENLKLLRDDLSVNLRPKHPKMIKLNDDIARAEKLLEFYRAKSREDLIAARQRLENQIQFVEQSITNWEAKALEANTRLTAYERSRANAQRLQAICDDLTRTIQKVELDKALAQETLTKLDEGASIGLSISKPWARKIALGILMGLAAGGLIVYLIERVDDRVVPSTDLAGDFELSIIGRVPEVKLLQSPDRTKALPRPRDRQLFAESYRNLRSSLLFMPGSEHRPKTIVITSAVPYEGKSTVTVNLAETLARGGCRVLLVDGDLRRGELQKSLQLPGEPGLSDVLQGQVSASDAVLRTSHENLFFLPVGRITPSPGELFLGSRTDAVLKELAEQYDFILIDSPPILATDDTTSLAPKTDGVLFVVRESFSKAGLIRPAIDQLLQRQAKVVGLIVNRADSSSKEYCYYKYPEYYGAR
jgi:capsular exopolysaccharide synthesis family protein